MVWCPLLPSDPTESDFEYLKGDLAQPRFIDPDWSLEQIIGRMAGLDADDTDPF